MGRLKRDKERKGNIKPLSLFGFSLSNRLSLSFSLKTEISCFRRPSLLRFSGTSAAIAVYKVKPAFWMDAIEDIFESTLNLEGSFIKEGYDEGYADGSISGKAEGEQVGLKTGFETGEELGFYRGCVDVWSSAIRVDPSFISPRIQKTIKHMDELLQNYPMLEPENESVSDAMDALRFKFRIVCASLNLKLEYNGYSKASDSGNIEF